MSAIRRAATVGLAVAMLSAATSAWATPQIGLSWNRCDQVETAHPIVGADRVAHLFVYTEGLSGSVSGFEMVIRISSSVGENCGCGIDGTHLTPAWSFEDGGCQGPERLHANLGPSGTGCPALLAQPAFSNVSTTRDSTFCYPGSCGTAWETVSLQALATHPWIFAGSERTAVWAIDFDLSGSCAFSAPGSDCCPDDSPMTILIDGNALMADQSRVDLGRSTVSYSADAVPARPASWGWIKGTYR